MFIMGAETYWIIVIITIMIIIIYSKIQLDNGTTGDINVTWEWSCYDYGAGVFAAMLVCLFGWVS